MAQACHSAQLALPSASRVPSWNHARASASLPSSAAMTARLQYRYVVLRLLTRLHLEMPLVHKSLRHKRIDWQGWQMSDWQEGNDWQEDKKRIR